jgi:signal transduction histidine kinase
LTSLRARLWLVGVAGAALALADCALTLSSHHAELRGVNGPLGAMIVLAFVMTGIFAWSRRPENRVGRLMVATGFAFGGVGLEQANSALLFSIGGAIGPLYLVFITWLVLAFPDGRVESRLGNRLLWIGFFDVLVIYELGVLLDIHISGDVPDNLFAIVHAPGLASVFDTMSAATGALIIATVVGIVWRERRQATPVARHAAAPVLRTGLFCLSAVAISLAIGSTGISDVAHGVAGSIAALAFFALPFAYLIGLLRSRYARAGRVGELLGALSARASLRDTLAEALGDPSLRLVYRTGTPTRWMDRDGRAVELPDAGVTFVERDGECIGAIVHDPALEDEPELVQAVAAAAGLALENERLEADLRARVAELQESRSKLIEVSMAERRSLERDLHDGAQQRLVALSVQVGLAKRKLHDDPVTAEQLLDRAGHELMLALEELRELARGIHPAILTDRGLSPALQALIDRAPPDLDVELSGAPEDRLPAPVEAAAYFVVAESLTNIAKYADAEHASVSVHRRNGHAIVEVRDDGVGGADPEAGSGLRGLADRLTIIDGRLEVLSPRGEGTLIRAEIPCG